MDQVHSHTSNTIPTVHLQELRIHQSKAQGQLLPVPLEFQGIHLSSDGTGVDLYQTTSVQWIDVVKILWFLLAIPTI